MNAQRAIDLAEKHASNNPSAAVCLMDAKHCAERGLKDHAKRRARDSLAYSVGIFHEDYKSVASQGESK